MASAGSILGNAVKRVEDPVLLTGAGQYVDDLRIAGTAHMVFVRSTFAHGRLLGVDTSDAAGMPGVLAVYSGSDLGFPPIPLFDGMDAFGRPVFCTDKVRFVGDVVAAIVAETREQAADAAEAVIVDIDPLPAVLTAAQSLAPDAPKLFDDAEGGNVCFATELGEGDVLEGAAHISEVEMVSQRLAGAPMENNGCLAEPNVPEGGMTFHVSHQAPNTLHGGLSAILGMEPEKLRVTCPWVGGGFGPKAAMYTEYLAVAGAARELGRPVKWIATRSEDMLTMVQGRDYVMKARLGLDADGKIVGMEADVKATAGAYPAIGAILPLLTQLLMVGVYDIPKVKFNGITALTNNTTIGAYRGAGRPEATQLLERVLDVAADEMGIDPAEIRRRNYYQPEAFPLTSTSGANYDSGEYEKSLDAVLEAAGYQDLLAEQARRREANDPKMLGIGVSTYVEVTAPVGLHVEWGAVEVHDDGTASMFVGTAAHGQGHATAFAMILSDMLGIPIGDIKHVDCDTAQVPRGSGTLGSRSLQTAGSAVHVASSEVLARAKKIAAHLLEASEDDVVVGQGRLEIAGTPTKALTWAELAKASNDQSQLPEGMEAGTLRYEGDFDGSDSTFPFGSHISVVEVDRDTGAVEMIRHIAVDDCGRILNPLLVNGQQHGGIAQGAAQALYEHVQFDEEGNPVTGSLMDYTVPAATELPSYEVSNTETDSPRNPLGAKGIGESGTIGSTPAIHNAVVDAVSHLGVKHIDMPCTPERVWKAIQAATS